MNTPTNFNQPTPPSNFGGPNNNNNDNSKRLVTIMGVALAVLLGLSIFLLISKYQTGQKYEATATELAEQKTAFTELDATYNEAVTQLEQQKGINAELDAKINEQLAQLETQKNEVAQLIRDKKSYRAAMTNLEKQKVTYLAEIDDLKKQNGILTDDNSRLSTENVTLNTSLSDTRTQLESESTAKAALISEKTQLETERTQLVKKVDVASAIRVKNIEVKSTDVRNSGKEKNNARAKNVDKLNICFFTEPNEVVPAGQEMFYIRIVDPTGAPLAIESLGSGVATDKRNETDVRYTTSASTDYDNGEKKVCGAWQPGQNFIKGKYSIEIYNKGYLVGTSAFNLK